MVVIFQIKWFESLKSKYELNALRAEKDLKNLKK